MLSRIKTRQLFRPTNTGDNRTVENGSFEDRMETFVIAFVKEFEIRLYFYDLIHKGQIDEAKKLSPSFRSHLEKVMGDIGQYGGFPIGFIATLALATTPLSLPAVAAATSVGFQSISGAKTGLESTGAKINSKLHDEKRKDYANKLWHFIKLQNEDRINFRKILISVALEIFRCFEQQFVKVNNNQKWRKGMIDLAEDGVYRSINYSVKYNEATNDEAIISMGVLEGQSKNRPKRKLVYEDENGQINWTSTSIYGKSGIARENDGEYSYYEKYSSRVRKYGYRLLLHAEDWTEIVKEYRLSEEKENRFQNYNYQFKTLNDDEKKQISCKIDTDNDILTKGNLKEIIKEVKYSILNEINQSLKLRCEDRNPSDTEILQQIASNIKKIDARELMKKILELDEIKRLFQETNQKLDQHHNENRALHQETYRSVQETKQNQEKYHNENKVLHQETYGLVQETRQYQEQHHNENKALHQETHVLVQETSQNQEQQHYDTRALCQEIQSLIQEARQKEERVSEEVEILVKNIFSKLKIGELVPSTSLPRNGSFYDRMESFVVTFVKGFEDLLYFYDQIHRGEIEEAKKQLPLYREKVMSDVGQCGGDPGVFHLLNLESTSFLPATGSKEVYNADMMLGKAISEKLTEKATLKWDKKHEDDANRLWHLIKLYNEDKINLKDTLISAALDIFKCFEQQFVKINDNRSWRSGMIYLAKEAVNRSINYCTKHYETTNNEEIISIGVIKGESKISLSLSYLYLYLEPELVYKDENGLISWTSSEIFEKTGIAVRDDEKYFYYEKNDQSSEVHKYGYRLLLQAEDWDKMKEEYKLSQDKQNRFQNYEYQLKIPRIR